MLRSAVKFLLLAEAFAVGTYALGWWAVPLVSLVCGLTFDRAAKPVSYSTLCAIAGWLTLLLIDAARGPVGEVAARLGGVIGFPPAALIACTLLFPALLAWSASSIGAIARGKIFRGPEAALADA